MPSELAIRDALENYLREKFPNHNFNLDDGDVSTLLLHALEIIVDAELKASGKSKIPDVEEDEEDDDDAQT